MDIFIGIIMSLLATLLICTAPFLFERLAKRINPNYETYSEFLAKMSDEKKSEYMRAQRKYRNNSKIHPMSPLTRMHKRVKPQRYGGRK